MIASPKVKQIQYHDGYWYALGVSCDCVLKHSVDSIPDINNWVEVTSGVVTQFKINFNGDLFALLNDQNLHQWDFQAAKWIVFYNGPFVHFDVSHTIFVLKTDHHEYFGKLIIIKINDTKDFLHCLFLNYYMSVFFLECPKM